MNEEDLEMWFRSDLLPNLPTDRNIVIVIDNAKYHDQLVEKKSLMKIRKDNILAFMANHNIPIPFPVPAIPVLIQKIKYHNAPS